MHEQVDDGGDEMHVNPQAKCRVYYHRETVPFDETFLEIVAFLPEVTWLSPALLVQVDTVVYLLHS